MKKTVLKLTCLLALNLVCVKSYAQVEEQDTLLNTVAKNVFDLEAIKRLKITGYIQTQFQYADSSGQSTFNGGSFPAGTDKRFAVRRGRVKFQYDAVPNEKGISTSQYVLQFDVTEKGLTIKDAYLRLTDKWVGWVSLTAGMQNRPFGNEIVYSSNLRESPERGRMSQIIFPGERDLGAMISIQGPKTSNWNWLKLDAGMFNGTGARGAGFDASDFDKNKDFIGHLSLARTNKMETFKYSGGVSYYYGGFRIDTVGVFKIASDTDGVQGFVAENKKSDFYNIPFGNRKEAYRKYMGADAQFSFDWIAGITTIRAEYIEGDQPGFTSSTSPYSATTSPQQINTSDIYKRSFNGAYFYFLQNILQMPLQLIVKYDWYDPNTDIEGNDIGKKVTVDSDGKALKSFTAADLKYETWGFGLAYRYDSNIRITAYYDAVKNETSENIVGYTKDLKDNVFTLRLQVRF